MVIVTYNKSRTPVELLCSLKKIMVIYFYYHIIPNIFLLSSLPNFSS